VKFSMRTRASCFDVLFDRSMSPSPFPRQNSQRKDFVYQGVVPATANSGNALLHSSTCLLSFIFHTDVRNHGRNPAPWRKRISTKSMICCRVSASEPTGRRIWRTIQAWNGERPTLKYLHDLGRPSNEWIRLGIRRCALQQAGAIGSVNTQFKPLSLSRPKHIICFVCDLLIGGT
jgi:hypothetical protein